jgi:hypothetical protein
MARAHRDLGPHRSRLIHAALIDGQLPRAAVPELRSALDCLAGVYGLTTRRPPRTVRSKGEKHVH